MHLVKPLHSKTNIGYAFIPDSSLSQPQFISFFLSSEKTHLTDCHINIGRLPEYEGRKLERKKNIQRGWSEWDVLWSNSRIGEWKMAGTCLAADLYYGRGRKREKERELKTKGSKNVFHFVFQ